MKIESQAFSHGQQIPRKYTCEGEDISPPLFFHDIPKEAQSLVLIVDDPDAPRGTFDHWIVWNIPATTSSVKEGTKPIGRQGINHFQELRYRGPCPPPGKPHRYFFKLYALDIQLNLPEGSNKQQVEESMEGHILGNAELMGTYSRNQ